MFSHFHTPASRTARRGRLLRLGVAGLLGLLVGLAALVLARRWAGALGRPLDPGTLLLTGAIVAVMAGAVRTGWLLAPLYRARPVLDALVMAITLAAVLALSVGLCVPGTEPVAKLLLFILLASEEGCAWTWYLDRSAASRKTVCFPECEREPRGEPCDEVLPKDVVQQLIRSQAADGTECLSGWLRVPFAVGQRTGSVHVAFCPPLVATPELAVEQLDGPETRIKTAQVLPYGARLDLKLAAAAEEPSDVLLQFSARAAKS